MQNISKIYVQLLLDFSDSQLVPRWAWKMKIMKDNHEGQPELALAAIAQEIVVVLATTSGYAAGAWASIYIQG